MGRKALFSVAVCLMCSGTLALNSFMFKDSQTAESAARLYRHVPGAVYASAAPYGAHSYQIPTYVEAQRTAASKVTPVKESIQNAYLRDSYGNRFVEALQSMKSIPFKPFPQQYVQLQELPAHFAQPLSAAPSVSYQYNQGPPVQQVIVGSHYRLPVQAAGPSQHSQFSYSQTHPGAYAGNLRNLAPASYVNSFRPQLGPVIQLQSVNSASPPQEFHKTQNPTVQTFSQTVTQNHEPSTAQQQPIIHEVIYNPDEQPQEERYHHLHGEHKFQRLQEAPQESSSEEESIAPIRHVVHKEKAKLKVSATKDTPIPTVVNGKTTVVNVETKPPIPLLDISLLEPLTFANPLVPQVQHFLPKIAQATYHRLPEANQPDQKKYHKQYSVQKTKTYDSGVIHGKPKKVSPKKKHREPDVEHIYHDEYIPQATARPTVAVQLPDEAPEISYEINSPNYKETYKEKAVKYNKETQSEPVHYTYGTNTHKEPVHYSYTHSSKEPITIKEVRYEGKGEGPKHLIYNFKPEQQNKERETSKTEAENDSGESPNNSDEDAPRHYHHREHTEHQSPSHGKSQSSHHLEAEHRDNQKHNKPHFKEPEYNPRPASESKIQHHKSSSGKQGQAEHHYPLDVIPFQNVAQYEEDISLTAPIKVDPNQHVQEHSAKENGRPSAAPQHNFHQSTSQKHHSEKDFSPHHETPSTHVHEKTKQVYIQEETPEDDDSVEEHVSKSMFGQEENKEKDFEKAYKDAAFGFPAYSKSGIDAEKDIYDPESYGAPREHSNYDIDHTPFEQYQQHGDDYPKDMRSSYKDDRDKNKEDYYLDYSVSKPESLLDRYKNKVGYYKLFKNQKPEKYVIHDDKNKQKKSEKLTAFPSYSYFPIPENQMKQFFGQYNAAPMIFEYDFSKGMPKDNSAHGSSPYQNLKMKTHFVEPQFQYGFEPISLPRLLDSELAAMASNVNSDSEKPGTRKKIYKENFYIKKTSMSDARPNS